MKSAPVGMASTAGILVAHDPASNPVPALEQLVAVLGLVIIVDNAVAGHPQLSGGWSPQAKVRLIRNANRGGLAGAYNAALRLIFREAGGIRYVVFVDEDSDTASLCSMLSNEATGRALVLPKTAAVAPAHRDRATGLRARHLRLTRFTVRSLPREVRGLVRVAFVINSMSLWRVEALTQIGPFDEALAVDQVDIDYCMRARQAGFDVWLNADCEFAHAVGARRAYTVLGGRWQSGGHGLQRRFLIGRNCVWLAKRYHFDYPSFAVLCILRIAYEASGIAVAEADKVGKLWQLFRGVARGTIARRPALPRSSGWFGLE